MLNKLLLLLVSFVSGRIMKGTLPNPVTLTTDAIKRFALGTAVSIMTLIVFTAGLALTLVDLYDVHRQQQILALSDLAFISLPMLLLPVLAVAGWAIALSVGQRRARQRAEAAAHSSVLAPIIEAVTNMIHTYANEQKVKRYNSEVEQAATPPHKPHPDVPPVRPTYAANDYQAMV